MSTVVPGCSFTASPVQLRRFGPCRSVRGKDYVHAQMLALPVPLATWLTALGLLAGQFGLAAVGGVLLGLVIAARLLLSRHEGVAPHRHRTGRHESPVTGAILDRDLLRDALRLCHPDVHPRERADMAHEVTVRLTEAWRKLR